jgi:hypothetical protein
LKILAALLHRRATDVVRFTPTLDRAKPRYPLSPKFALDVVHRIANRLMADRSRVI